MNAPIDFAMIHSQRLAADIAQACNRIAPTWPLDRFIAVNPYAGWSSQAMDRTAAELATLCGTSLLPPHAFLVEQWQSGRLRREHLQAACSRFQPLWHGGEGADLAGQVDTLIAALHQPAPQIQPLPLVTRLRDAAESHPIGLSWTERVTHQISQHCAAFFDRSQSRWGLDPTDGLLQTWHRSCWPIAAWCGVVAAAG